MVEKLKNMLAQKPGELEKKVNFLKDKIDFLKEISGASNIEMELINKGMAIDEARVEAKNISRLSSL
jgi:hypothetical protein